MHDISFHVAIQGFSSSFQSFYISFRPRSLDARGGRKGSWFASCSSGSQPRTHLSNAFAASTSESKGPSDSLTPSMVTLTENCPSLEVVYTPLYVSCCSFVVVRFGQSIRLPPVFFSIHVPPRTDFPLTTMVATLHSLETLPGARGCAVDGAFRACARLAERSQATKTSTTIRNPIRSPCLSHKPTRIPG